MKRNRRKGKERENEGIVIVRQRGVDEIIMQQSGNWRHKTRVENGWGKMEILPSSAVTAKSTAVSAVAGKAAVTHPNCIVGTGGGRPFLALITHLIWKKKLCRILEDDTVLFNNFSLKCFFLAQISPGHGNINIWPEKLGI